MSFDYWLTKIFGMSKATYYNLGSTDQEEIYDIYKEETSD